jgi:DNA-binding response OmpR family regulator
MQGTGLKKILIIEDQPDIRKLVIMTLDFNDYEIHDTADAETGLRMVEEIGPDLILLDIMMPGKMDGLALCRLLKGSKDYSDIPLILLTARGQQADREAGMDAGADEYMVKPFSPIKLIEVVEAFMSGTGKH